MLATTLKTALCQVDWGGTMYHRYMRRINLYVYIYACTEHGVQPKALGDLIQQSSPKRLAV